MYSGLYRYDGRDNAVPDLADGPCFVPGADGKVIRCRLIETTFQDGTPLTADDVAYTYQVFQRAVMDCGSRSPSGRRCGSSTRGRSTSSSRPSTRPS